MTVGIPRSGGAELDTGRFDETFDVVIAGYGFAGGISAIEAADNGASVLICEKMPDPGGLSICSGGAVRCADSADDAFAYLEANAAGTTRRRRCSRSRRGHDEVGIGHRRDARDDFRGNNYQLDVHAKHTPSDHPCLRMAAVVAQCCQSHTDQ
jgi:flavin-dependent dehydrogenase